MASVTHTVNSQFNESSFNLMGEWRVCSCQKSVQSKCIYDNTHVQAPNMASFESSRFPKFVKSGSLHLRARCTQLQHRMGIWCLEESETIYMISAAPDILDSQMMIFEKSLLHKMPGTNFPVSVPIFELLKGQVSKWTKYMIQGQQQQLSRQRHVKAWLF